MQRQVPLLAWPPAVVVDVNRLGAAEERKIKPSDVGRVALPSGALRRLPRNSPEMMRMR